MPPASVNTMSRSSQILQTIEPPQAPLQIEASNAFDLREFVADEDAVNFSSTLWKSIDQSAFVLAQREALEAFNVAKAIRLSEETAAVESKRRSQGAASASRKTSVSPETQASSSSSAGSSNATQSQPIAIRKSQHSISSAPAPASDEAAAISLARSWRVDSLQPALLDNNSNVSSHKTHQKSSSSVSTSSSSHHYQQQHHHHHERKPSSSIVKQPSKNLSLSTSSSFLDSRIASDSTQVHSRATPSNVIPSSPSAQSHRIEQRSLSKREPEPPSISMSPPSSSQVQTSDVTSTKRRRTERQTSTSTSTSTSTPSSHNMLVAPSISHSKKSTASARDVRLGQMINPINEVAAAPPVAPSVERRLKSVHNSARKPSDTDLFTAIRKCAKCRNPVASPRTQPTFTHDAFSLPFSDVLHVACSACHTTHCRGCFTIARCPRDCTGGTNCTVKNCCPEVRAIAIFEALSSFDHIYIAEAGSFAGQNGNQRQDRLAFIRRLLSKTEVGKFENAFVCTLHIVCSWLQRPENEEEEEGDSGSGLHPSVAKLFASSYLPEVVHIFLSNTIVGGWVAHSTAYTAILDTLRCMFDCGLKEFMMHPVFHIAQSPGLQHLVWDQGSLIWERDAGQRPVQSSSLCDLVKQLEVYRKTLTEYGEKMQFEHTVKKVGDLGDRISYLVLQQVLGSL